MRRAMSNLVTLGAVAVALLGLATFSPAWAQSRAGSASTFDRTKGICGIGGTYTGIWSTSDASRATIKPYELRVTCLSKARAQFEPLTKGGGGSFIADLVASTQLGGTVELSVRTDLDNRKNGTAVPELGTLNFWLTIDRTTKAMENFTGYRKNHGSGIQIIQ